MKQIEKIITEINEFPTLPTVYLQLLTTIDRPDSSASDVAKVISTDQSAALKVLKAVNSPIYGLRGKVSSIEQAIVYLGFNEVKNLVLALSVISMFSGTRGLETIKPADFWRHSMGVGLMARKIGAEIKATNLDDYFIAGILHTVGRLIFLKTVPDTFAEVLATAKGSNLNTREIEKNILGMSHTIAGSLLLEKWKLPKILQDTVSYQYLGVSESGDRCLIAAIHLSMIAANMMELGVSGDNKIPKLNFNIWTILNLDVDFFKSNMKNFSNEFDQTVQLFLE